MAVDVAIFMQQQRPGGHRQQMALKKEEILALFDADYAYDQIVLWLLMCGINTSVQAVKEFIHGPMVGWETVANCGTIAKNGDGRRSSPLLAARCAHCLHEARII